MKTDQEVLDFLTTHLTAIQQNDVATYHDTTGEDLTLYEWWVTPHRIDGLPFHDFMMEAMAESKSVFGAQPPSSSESRTRFDLANLHVQHYGDTAIASYTLLISTATKDGVRVTSHNETRVMVMIENRWQVVHVHKSPTWQSPHDPDEFYE
jgi:ketosteroid isomerase-like protein